MPASTRTRAARRTRATPFQQFMQTAEDATNRAVLDRLAQPPTRAARLLAAALRSAPAARARGLAYLHPYLESAATRNLAEFAISELGPEHRARAYGLLAATAVSAEAHRRWFEAELAAVGELRSDVKRIAALVRAAEHTPGALWEDLLGMVAQIRTETQRGNAFRQLLPRVPEGLLTRVQHAMLFARRPEDYSAALVALIAAVPGHQLPMLRQRVACLPDELRAEPAAAFARRESSGRAWLGPVRMPFEGGNERR